MSIETTPDASTDNEAMSIEQIRQELGAYQPGTAAEVIEIDAHGRARLWPRLDALTRLRVVAP